jgi:glycosyltransferase involved in cell wall biosynthesis
VLARHPDAEFEFVGNDTRTAPDGGSMRAHLERALAGRGAGERVRFLDQRPQEELISLYQRCALFVLPSQRDVYPNAVLEAMACARPVVVTSGVGVAELVAASGGGSVIAPGDAKALADAISRLLALPEDERDRIGMNARNIVERHCSTTEIARETVLAYRAIGHVVGHAA